MKNYHIILDGTYTFNAEDDFGDFCNGVKRKGSEPHHGYRQHIYLCDDGAKHAVYEHVAKWEYFNGRIPDELEIDHIIPVSNGGTNILSNLRLVDHRTNCLNENSRRNHSEKSSGERNGMYGKHHSEEAKKQISSKIRGKLVGRKDISKLVDQTDSKTGEVLNTYVSACEAARANNCASSSIILASNGKFGKQGHKALDYMWFYHNVVGCDR